MSHTPVSRHEKMSGASSNAIELQSLAGDNTTSRVNGKNLEAIMTEEDENELKGSTANDRHDMDRLGKKQELRVRCINDL